MGMYTKAEEIRPRQQTQMLTFTLTVALVFGLASALASALAGTRAHTVCALQVHDVRFDRHLAFLVGDLAVLNHGVLRRARPVQDVDICDLLLASWCEVVASRALAIGDSSQGEIDAHNGTKDIDAAVGIGTKTQSKQPSKAEPKEQPVHMLQ